jgi:spore germination protein GerM
MNNQAESRSKTKSFFLDFFKLVICQILILIRRMSKVVLHFVTKKSELERICENENIESVRIKKLGICLVFSLYII